MATEGVNLRCFVLGLLCRYPMSGYDIKRLILAQGLPQKGLMAHLRKRHAHVAAHRDALKELSGEPEQAGRGWQMALD